MGLPGVAYLTGVADAAWTAIGLAIGTYLNWLIVAKRLRRYTVVAGNSITIPSFFPTVIAIRADPGCGFGDFYRDLLYPVYGVRIRGLRKTLLHIVWRLLRSGDDRQCDRDRGLYGAGRIFRGEHDRSDPEYRDVSLLLICVVLFGVKTAGGTDVILSQAGELPGYLSMTQTYMNGRSDRVWRDQDCVYACMGAWLFWNAAYFASVYGDRR